MKNIKSLLTLTLIGGSIILTGCSGNIESDAAQSNTKQRIQVVTTSSNDTISTVDLDSLEKDLKALEDGEYNVKWEDELEAKYGDDWEDAMEAKYGETWDDELEAKMNAKLNEGTTKEDLIKSIEGDLSKMLNRVEAPVNWEDELEVKYGDDFDDLMEQKHGDNWENEFEAQLMK